MVVFVAKYAEFKNENNIVVIDDSTVVPMLIYKDSVSCGQLNPMKYGIGTDMATSDVGFFWVTWFNWKNAVTVLESSDSNVFPFKGMDSMSTAQLLELAESLIICAKPINGNFGVRVYTTITKTNGVYKWVIYVNSEIQNGVVEFCVFNTTAILKPSTGIQCAFYNSSGDLIYDFLKPPMHVLGNCYGGVNARNNPAAVYDITLPSGVDSSFVYLTTKSALPFISSFKINSGGVSQYLGFYKAVMYFNSPTALQVKLERIGDVRNNSVDTLDMYFENVIYCPYPKGKYF